MVKSLRPVVAATAALLALPLLAQVTVAPKAGAADTFTVKLGASARATLSLQRVAEYPAEKLKKSCQDQMYRGLQVLAAWDLVRIEPASGVTVGIYDDILQVERRGYPSHPLATVQGEGFQMTVHWVTPFKLKALGYCHDDGAYTWWRMDAGGGEAKRVGLLLDIVTEAGREWWILERCGDAPTTLRKVEAPGTIADLDCPQGGK